MYTWNLYLIKNVKDVVVFLGLKVFNFDNIFPVFQQKKCTQVTFVKKSQSKIISFENYKHWYSKYTDTKNNTRSDCHLCIEVQF